MDSAGLWKPYRSVFFTKTCTVCYFETAPVLYLKGLCYDSHLDWLWYTVQEDDGGVAYEGYKVYAMWRQQQADSGGRQRPWAVANRAAYHGSSLNISLDDRDATGYLAGRKDWVVQGDIGCTAENNRFAAVNLSPCRIGSEFTCSNGQCVPAGQRCDQNFDCKVVFP